MDTKTEENDERNQRERLLQRKAFAQQALSNQINNKNQYYKHNRRGVTISFIEDETTPQSNTRQFKNNQTLMNSSVQSETNSTKNVKNNRQTFDQDDERSTYSFRYVTKKLQHAKSYGELYQPRAPLPLPSNAILDNSENEIEHPVRHSSELITTQSPVAKTNQQTARWTTTTDIDNGFDTSSTKDPIWKRLKKMMVPTKRNKERRNSSPRAFNASLNRTSPGETSRIDPDNVDNNRVHILRNPIKTNELKTWIVSKPFPEQRIRDEYERLPTEPLFPKTIALRPENKMKNRFTSYEPYDHSRVILQPLSNDPSSDYINASYIDGFRINKLYIAAQGPTETTLYDFIRMIWQLNIQSIVMVTRLFEDGKHKCFQYWPDEHEKRINNFKIRLENEEKYADYTIRRLAIYNQSEPSGVLQVKQYHFLTWPDHGCLSLVTPLLDFRQRFRAEYKSTSPILVHCSAGVGRSGTFIALDSLLETIKYQDTVDVLELTHRMRQNRISMIQTTDQYVFVYRALVEGLLTMDTVWPLKEYLTTRKIHVDAKNQYKLLEQLQTTVELTYRDALNPVNFHKNRTETILPSDNNRPFLMTLFDKGTDYINAVFINSYRQAPSYIVTQFPLTHTRIDFWRLVYDHNVSIIMLTEPIFYDSKTVPYWCSTIGQATTFGPFEITLTSQKEDEQLIERIFEIYCLHKNTFTIDRTKTVRQFQIKEHSHILTVAKRFLKEVRTYRDQNVILQCLNGATWSGYFAALCNSIDKMQTEKIVDPFKIVRLLRAVRPQFIDQEQYENLIRAIHDYAQKLVTKMSTENDVENVIHSNSNDTGHSSATHRFAQRL